jgi:hypothetical protein
MVAEVERTAAMGEPAHDHLVGRDDLLPVDAEVLPLLVRPARDDQTPGDQRTGVVRPAGLHRQATQIDVLAFPHHLLTGGRRHLLRRHREHLPDHRQLVPGVAQTLGRFGFLQHRQRAPDVAQRLGPLFTADAHAQRHAARRAEQVAEHRHVEAAGLFEQDGRSLRAQHAVADFGHFEIRATPGAPRA